MIGIYSKCRWNEFDPRIGRYTHAAGNAFFRQVVAEQLNDFKWYQSQKNRHGMGIVVQRIVQRVHDTGGRFMDQNWRGMVRLVGF